MGAEKFELKGQLKVARNGLGKEVRVNEKTIKDVNQKCKLTENASSLTTNLRCITRSSVKNNQQLVPQPTDQNSDSKQRCPIIIYRHPIYLSMTSCAIAKESEWKLKKLGNESVYAIVLDTFVLAHHLLFVQKLEAKIRNSHTNAIRN